LAGKIIPVNDSILCVIDIQEKLLPHISNHKQVVKQSGMLIEAAGMLDVPLVVSEQVPRALGPTVPETKEHLQDIGIVEKKTFSCMACEDYEKALQAIGRKTLVLCGIEAHVCIMLTAFEALEKGYNVVVVADAVGSRTDANCQVALARMRQEGVFIVSAEMMIMEWIGGAAHPKFREIIRLVK
jgi:Isochorismatase family